MEYICLICDSPGTARCASLLTFSISHGSVFTPEFILWVCVCACTHAYLEQPPAGVEIIDAFQVGRWQLDVVRTESGRQLVHVRYVILNRGDLILELLPRAQTQVGYYAALFTTVRGQMGTTDRLLVRFSLVSHLQRSNSGKQMHPSCKLHFFCLFNACWCMEKHWQAYSK